MIIFWHNLKGGDFIKCILECLFFFFEFGKIPLCTKKEHYLTSKVEIKSIVRILSRNIQEVEKSERRKNYQTYKIIK